MNFYIGRGKAIHTDDGNVNGTAQCGAGLNRASISATIRTNKGVDCKKCIKVTEFNATQTVADDDVICHKCTEFVCNCTCKQIYVYQVFVGTYLVTEKDNEASAVKLHATLTKLNPNSEVMIIKL